MTGSVSQYLMPSLSLVKDTIEAFKHLLFTSRIKNMGGEYNGHFLSVIYAMYFYPAIGIIVFISVVEETIF